MCCSVVFGIMSRRFVINISSSSTAINKLRHLLPAISVTICGAWSVGVVVITPGRLQPWKHAVKPDIGSESRFLPIPPAFNAPSEYCYAIGTEKLEWCGYPMVKTNKHIFKFFSPSGSHTILVFLSIQQWSTRYSSYTTCIRSRR